MSATETRRAVGGRFFRWRHGWSVAARFAVGGLRSTPGRTAFTVVLLAIGAAVMAVDHNRESVEIGLSTVGLTIVFVTALGAARIPDPVRLRTSAMLSLVGAPRSVRRRIAMVDGGLSGAMAVGPGLLLGWLASQFDGIGTRGWSTVVWSCLVGPVIIAALAGGRDEATLVQPAQGAVRTRVPGPVRLICASVLVFLGIAIPGSAQDWFNLDLTLVPGLILVGTGLSLIAPMVFSTAGRGLARIARHPSARLAGSLAVDRRRALGPAACLVAAGSAAVVVQAVLGSGLATREADRQQKMSLRAGTRSDQVIVHAETSDFLPLFSPTREGPAAPFAAVTLQDIAKLTSAAPPGSSVAPVVTPVVAAGAPGNAGGLFLTALTLDQRSDSTNSGVALATPELLRALRLERFAPDVAAGRALVLDPEVELRSGQVSLLINDPGVEDLPSTPISARAVGGTGTPSRLPPVLVPESMLKRLAPLATERVLTGAVVRGTAPATAEEIGALRSAIPSATVMGGGDIDIERLEETRLDAAGSVLVRTSADVVGGVLLVGLAGVVALVVGLRFAALAHRAEDDLFEVVGAPPAILRRISAWQGALVTLVGIGLGLPVGLIGTASGIARYNASGREGLPPIPFEVPGLLLVGLLVLPLVGATFAWLSAGQRPSVDPVLLAERAAW